MAQYQITVDAQLLERLLVRDDGLAGLAEEVVNQVLQQQLTEQVGAARHEQTEERTNLRNGVRERTLQTRIGPLKLTVPRVRQGSFETELFARYQRSEQAFMAALIEMVVQGVSTRKVDAIVEELCGAHFSKSTVSALCQRLDPLVSEWNERPLHQTPYPFVVVDALVIRVRKGGRVRAMSLLVSAGICWEGRRHILGLSLGDCESEASWSEHFAALKRRGLSGVDLVVSDSHAGLVKTLRQYCQGASWQRCQTHLSRNVLDACPKSLQKPLHRRLRELYEAATPEQAKGALLGIIEEFGQSAMRAVGILEDAFEDATAVLSLPEYYRKRLRTTNGQERLNEEIRRRERVIRIFPNEASAIRLVGALLMEWDEEWSTGRCYLDMAEYHAFRERPPASSGSQAVTPLIAAVDVYVRPESREFQ